jgi:hypothetical protein
MDKDKERALRAIADDLAAEVLARAALIRARYSVKGKHIGLEQAALIALADMAKD